MLFNAFVEFDQAALAIFADKEADGDDGEFVARHRVDVLNAVDLKQEFFQRSGNELFHLRSGMPRKLDVYIRQRNNDLWILFARGHDECDRPHDQ